MSFGVFAKTVAKQFKSMTESGGGLFRVDIDKDILWDTYLSSFPPGSNPIYKERTEHDCNACKGFIRVLGGVVSIRDGQTVSIWDVEADGAYQTVADEMSSMVKKRAIANVFLHAEPKVGVAKTFAQIADTKEVKTWEHFSVNLPDAAHCKSDHIGPALAEARSTFDVMRRSLQEIKIDSADTVLELIAQNSLYRGEEHAFAVSEFRKLASRFWQLDNPQARDLFVWANLKVAASVARIRNTAIGTLLGDLSDDVDLEVAVRAFESKVAPTNYKRPTALVTKAMVEAARQTVDELGFTSALERRYATIDDITINNVLFADRQTKREMNVFDDLVARAPEAPKSMDRVEEIGIQDFIDKVLPTVESLEVLVENRHAGNLVSLIAPSDPTARCMFKWPNNFSWSYVGDLTDSIKERVKRAGGNVSGDFRASLSWHNYDDLDLHLIEPGGFEIYYGNKRSLRTGGNLDVDMNAGSGSTRNAVENIVYPKRDKMLAGSYVLSVMNFCRRESNDVGFEVELEFEGTVHAYAHAKAVADRQSVVVCRFTYSHSDGLKITESLPSTRASRVIWGIPTETYRKVNAIMLSPNHWDGMPVGNKHYFFMLDGCLREDPARGLYNEFLGEELTPHRKVMEIIGSKLKTGESARQLSGLGFSSTQRNHILCRVKGAFSRVVKINF